MARWVFGLHINYHFVWPWGRLATTEDCLNFSRRGSLDMTNRIHPKKLKQSKWTARHPRRREKHFIVTDVHVDDEGHPVTCILQAVHSGAERELPWRELKDSTVWQMGWR